MTPQLRAFGRIAALLLAAQVLRGLDGIPALRAGG
jgi:hypothetical protein